MPATFPQQSATVMVQMFQQSTTLHSRRHQQLFPDCILSYNFKPRQFPVCLDDQCYSFFQVFACFFQCPALRVFAPGSSST